MICWVVERALAARNVARAIVAADDERILEAVKSAGHEAVMTRVDHRSGTDRIAEVAASLKDVYIVVNVQGDEPLISPETIERAIEAMGETVNGEKGEGGKGEDSGGEKGKGERGTGKSQSDHQSQVGIVTTWEPMESVADVLNPHVVKVVVDESERALYFSRLPVPFPRDAVRRYGSLDAALSKEPSLLSSFRKHTGLYVYRRDVLLEFARWPQSELERLESLEQLRALEHGVKIKAIKANTSSIGVDTMEDLERVRSIVEEENCSLEFKL